MTAQTAIHLNDLHRRANNPLVLQATTGPEMNVTGGTTTERLNILTYVEAARIRVAPEAIETEIRRAATERRQADTYTGDDSHSLVYWGQLNGHARHAGGIALALVIEDIRHEIDRLNTAATARYEAYRLACEQGVAVPPAE